MFSELMDIVRDYNKDESDHKTLEEAYIIAADAHKKQKRASGDPYITHPLETAKILAQIHMDTPTLTAAILHDVVEDTELGKEYINKEFGDEVANLVDGVTKLTAISESKEKGTGFQKTRSRVDKQAENLRKIFLAMAKDIRVILIKVADRLHNLRTLTFLSEKKQKFIAKETLEIFAPIASRLGMWEIKWQLEDLAAGYLFPDEFKELMDNVSQRRREREQIVEHVKEKIFGALVKVGFKNFHIEGRPKHYYSIFQKMTQRNCSLEDIYDLTAVRIIVNTVRECYQALGIVHNFWMPFHDRFKDYIAMPKSNNYRSLHTTVYGPANQPVEVQVRTWEMHRVDEYGIAAHWAYKEGGKADINITKEVYPWIRKILDFEDDSKDAREYIDNLKVNLLEMEVFVFTPKGDVIDLPAGSTPLDFAYNIHTEVGHRLIGAKVNTKIVPIDYKLKNADIVEIITQKQGSPSRDWLNIVKSSQARNKIKQWFKKERKEENIDRGKELIKNELERSRMDVSFNNIEMFGKIAKKYKFQSINDLFASVGYGETSPVTIMHRIRDFLGPIPVEIPPPEAKEKKKRRRRKSKSPVVIDGISSIAVKFARCCSPVQGDEIIGYVTLGKGASIHRKNCPSFAHLAKKKERVVEVKWSEDIIDTLYTTQLEVEAWDRTGLLSDVMGRINEKGIHANYCKAWSKRSYATIKVSVDIKSKDEMDELIKTLLSIKSVHSVARSTLRKSR
ncbi:MAG: bifunctional (p)ppGpp synthetase/guanosine-3',5'-bis(diphosphate) 3'-pyrophosphohydrolase [Candidatus Eremiobacteraeota bacterium]|nr:bifunctional (p)ppGpp synthetase/guanosine-3',5'-bis(diphosphate) 3'-pyrophosphohydrolase [Candidatus Eremiobacteraeota bacterium]